MSFQKYLLFFIIIIISSISNVALAQKDLPIRTSIFVQNAFSQQQVLGVRIVVHELNKYNEVLHSDSLGGTAVISKNFIPNHKYRLIVRKDGFYTKDTVIIPQLTSSSRKQRLALSLYPMLCYNISGKVVDARHSTAINRGKIRIQDLSNSELFEINIQHGYYKFCGKCAHEYRLTTKISGYLDKIEQIELRSTNCYPQNEQTAKLNMVVAPNYERAFLL